MPITRSTPALRRLFGVCALLSLTASALAAPTAGVAIVRAATWSPADEVGEGAGEFEVLVCVAQVQQKHRAAGVIGVGGRHGGLSTGAERALRHLATRGVPIAKIAAAGNFAPDPEQLFLDASGLTEAEASNVLTRCLERHGLAPAAANPEKPTAAELAAIREHLRPFREAFALATAARVAVK